MNGSKVQGNLNSKHHVQTESKAGTSAKLFYYCKMHSIYMFYWCIACLSTAMTCINKLGQ